MKSFELKLFSIGVGIVIIAIHWSCIVADNYGSEEEDISFEITNQRQVRALTPEEEALANDARAHIAKAIENNLVRLFAVISARSSGGRRPRQDDDDEDIASITPNPNVLPQVAQILGAIFSGSLNITRVVDQTFGLVPNIVRNQVGGLVKLLTGENMEEGASTVSTASAAASVTAPPPVVVTPAPATAQPIVKSNPAPPLPAVNEAVVVSDLHSESALQAAHQSNNATKGKYRVRSRTRSTSTTTPRTLLEDDEIEKLEEDIRRAARAYEPYVRDKAPRGFIDAFRQVFGRVDFNMTDINSAVPTIFKGARRAFQVLDNLGILDANDLLDELGLPPLYAEEEEEEE